MKCPSCTDTELAMTTRQQVEIDYCPKCRGVWLDRGELDKIVARSERDPDSGDDDDDHDDEKPHHSGGYRDQRERDTRRRSWWTELFD